MTDIKKTRISHSAWSRYLTCAHSYDLHYNKRLRPEKISSNLVFGSAIDNALLDRFLGHGEDPVEVFKADFTYEKNKDVYFEPKDYQPEIFTQEQLDHLKDKDISFIQWANFRVKGRYLIDAFVENIVPRINKVIDVQRETTGRPGFIDLIADIDDHGEVLLDLKTARRAYNTDQAEQSTQLALYAKDQGFKKVGFLVLVKTLSLGKVCSKCGFDGSGRQFKTCSNEINGSRCHGKWDIEVKPPKWQIIIQDVNELLQQNVIDSMTQVETAIEKKIFPKNLNNCGAIYGKICPYFRYCHHNDELGLTIHESSSNVKEKKQTKEKK